MLLREKLPAVAVAGLLALTAAGAAAEPVDLELVLAADGSGSIDDEEFAFQRRGYADAIRHPAVISAIRSGSYQRIAVAFVEWGAPESVHTIVDWTLISNEAEARAFGDRLVAAERIAVGYNSISEAIAYSVNLIESNTYEGKRKIIDVSGDGPQINGRPISLIRAGAIARGITINALVVKSEQGSFPSLDGASLEQHYRTQVIGGEGAFAMTVDGRGVDFARAVRRKLLLEIASR